MPPIVSVAGVLFPREHEEPVSGIVTVLVVLLPVAVPREQPEKPPVRATVGEAETPKAGSKVAVTVEPPKSAPEELGVNPTVYVVVAEALWMAGLKETPDGDVAAAMTTAEAGEAVAVSEVVLTVNVDGP